MKTINVGILGFGTVGAGVAQTLLQNHALIAGRSGLDIQLRRIADLDIHSDRGVEIDPSLLTTDAQAVLAADDIDIVVELIGGTGIAKDFTLQAFRNGKSVVTANKALLAEWGHEIFPAAAAAGVDIYYEASVAGGIPLIKAIREGLVGNHVQRIYGILNGTCNYILTRMENEGIDFDVVLKQAQELGYAEAEPSLDIDGFDTAHKTCLLAGMISGHPVGMKDLLIEGIRGLAAEDFEYAARVGYRLKLLSVIKVIDGELEARVQPTLIPRHHMMAAVSGPFNAAFVTGDIVGETMYYGAGAGRFPTASAVVGDIVDVARNLASESSGRLPSGVVYDTHISMRPLGETEARYYLRLSLLDQPGAFAEVAGVLGHHQISLASLLQQEHRQGDHVPVIVLTQPTRTSALQTALAEIRALPTVGPEIVKFTIEDLV